MSNAYLKAECETTPLYLRKPAAYEKSDVGLLLSRRVERLDRTGKRLTLDDGREVTYSKLALAVGGRARRMTTDDAARAERAGNVHYLRNIDDVIAIRSRFAAGCLGWSSLQGVDSQRVLFDGLGHASSCAPTCRNRRKPTRSSGDSSVPRLDRH